MAWIGFWLPILGFVSDLLKKRRLILIFCALFGVGISAMIIALPIKHSLILSLLFFGLGVAGAGQSVAFIVMAESVGKNLKGTALGLNNAGISFVIAVVLPVVGFLIQHSLHNNASQNFHVHNFTVSLMVMPILYAASLFVSLKLVDDPKILCN